jgi:hypothetical protein
MIAAATHGTFWRIRCQSSSGELFSALVIADDPKLGALEAVERSGSDVAASPRDLRRENRRD